MKVSIHRLAAGVAAWLGLGLVALAQQEPVVTFVSPPHNGVAAVDTDVVVHFNAAMDEATFTAAPNRFRVFGEQSGPIDGTLVFLPGNKRIRFEPAAALIAGETVRVTLSNEIRSLRDIPLRAAGYVIEFRTLTAPAEMDFRPVDGTSVRRSTNEPVRIYGGLGADFDDDGFGDLALVNEDSNDLRMLRNDGDASGHFTLAGQAEDRALGSRPSPSEAADFDLDGFTDVVASNTSGNDVTVLFGQGDGTFTDGLDLVTDWVPRGMGVIEANGDGFTDIVTANYTDGTGNVALLINDGQGGFLPAVTFDAGIEREWAIDVADMNHDAIQDIVVGGREAQTVVVLLGDGLGNFTFRSSQPTGGLTWRIVCADVDNNGTVDVTTANGIADNAAVLLNDGFGNLAPPTIVATGGFSTDTDLGDLDGDGDLDWIVSNFGGRSYSVFENQGGGSFALLDTWDAIDKPAGVVMMDFDRDEDLDLVLLDEIADYVTFLENQSGLSTVFCFGDGSGAACPCANTGDPGHGCDNIHGTRGVNMGVVVVDPEGGGGGIVTFASDGFNPANPVPYVPIRGANVAGGGAGVLLGDGLGCLAAPIVRLPPRIAEGGSDTMTIYHTAGSGTFHYQIVYRSQGAYCDPSQFNTTNAVTITWP